MPPVEIQLRRDLEFASYSVGFGRQVVVKDPLRMEYFFFRDDECGALEVLQQPRNLDELKQNIDRLISPGFIAPEEVQLFVNRLLQDNLVTTNRMGLGSGLLRRCEQAQRTRFFQTFSSLLAIRGRGIDPRFLLDLLNPVTKHLFGPVFLFLAVVLFVTSLVGAGAKSGNGFS